MNKFHVERERAVELAKRLLEILGALDTLVAEHWRGNVHRVAEQLAAARTLIDNVILLPNLVERPDDGISPESVRRIVRNSYFLVFDYLFRLEFGPETPDDSDEMIGRMFFSVAVDIDHLLATRTLRVRQ